MPMRFPRRIPARWLHRLLPLLALLPVPSTLGGCGGGGGTSSGPPDPDPFLCGFIPGQVTSSVGSSVGQAGIMMAFGDQRWVRFNNMSLTFYGEIYSPIGQRITGEIAYMGTLCPESITTWPGGTMLPQTVFVGHTYLVQFVNESEMHPPDPTVTTYIAFTVDAYSNGVLTFTWVEL
jgi:hypothetical protein